MTVLSNNWITTDLESITEILDYKRVPINSEERQKRKESKRLSELYPYYGATGQVDYINDYLFDGEYVLLGEDGAPFLDPLKNKAYIVSGKFWVNNHAHILKGYISNKYLCFYLNQYNFIGHVTGTTRLKLNQSSMKSITIKVAPLNEQNRIVQKIEKLFSDLDKAAEDLAKTQEQLKIYRQAVLKAAFEGKLTEEWRRKNKLNLSEKILKIRHNDIKEIYKIPLSWKWLFLNDIGFVVSGGTPSTKEPEYFNGEIPWITPKDLSGYNKKYISKGLRNISEKGLKESSAKLLPKGSIVFSSRAPIGYTAITENELCTNQGFKNIILNDGINSEYVYYYLRNNKSLAERYASGTTFKEISGSKFAILPIPLCNLKEQEQVVSEIESRLSVCDKLEETVQQSLNKIEYLRQSILKKAFEGKLVPQDPNDPPACELIKQIKIEKDKMCKNGK